MKILQQVNLCERGTFTVYLYANFSYTYIIVSIKIFIKLFHVMCIIIVRTKYETCLCMIENLARRLFSEN